MGSFDSEATSPPAVEAAIHVLGKHLISDAENELAGARVMKNAYPKERSQLAESHNVTVKAVNALLREYLILHATTQQHAVIGRVLPQLFLDKAEVS